jgi:DNA-binding CsgD family transcriptional regulator
VSARVPLIGRDAELAVVLDRLEAAAAGSGQVVLVEGEAGIGKTHLVAEALREAQRQGVRVLTAAGDQLESTRPFGPLIQVLGLRAWTAGDAHEALGRLLYAAAPDRGGPELSFLVVDAIVDLVEQMTSDGPVAIAIDDLHWADAGTLVALRSLARTAGSLPLALIAGYRPTPRSTELEQVIDGLRSSGATHVSLGPLRGHSVTALVRRVSNAAPGPRLLAQAEGAVGNPFFVIELVDSLIDQGVLTVDDGIVELRAGTRTSALPATVLRRLHILDAATFQVMRMASVLGTRFAADDLSAFTGRSTSELLPALDQAINARVLEDAGDSLTFRHDLIRETIYSDVPAAVRAGLHRDAARALAAAGAPVDRVAYHYAIAATPGDTEAVSWLERAAADSVSRSPATAAELLGRAVELATTAELGRDRLLAARANALAWAGRFDEAEAVAREALLWAGDDAVRTDVRHGLVSALFWQGRFRDYVEHAERAIAAGLASEREAFVLAAASLGHGVMGRIDRAEHLALEALALGRATGDVGAVVVAVGVQAFVAVLQARFDDALEGAREGVATADGGGAESHRFGALGNLGLALMESDQHDEAVEVLRRGLRRNEENGTGWDTAMMHMALGYCHELAGDWDDAGAVLETALAIASDTGTHFHLSLAYALLASIALHRDDAEAAARHLDAAEREFAYTGTLFGIDRVALSRALLAESRGAPDVALNILTNIWRAAAASGVIWMARYLGPDLVRLALTAGARDMAEEMTVATEHAARIAHVAAFDGAALRCRGLVESSVEILLESVDAYRRGPRKLALALACEDAAVALGRRQRREEAESLFDEAGAIYQSLGARWDERRAAAARKDLGLRARRPAPPRPRSGWDSLTPTERRVTALVGEGLTNREIAGRMFVSRRTVETHVAHVFTKLGQSNRSQLATEAVRHGPQREAMGG